MPEMNAGWFSGRGRRRARLVAGALVALGAGACADAPTLPAALHWLAAGEDWIAVLPPASLPSAAAWARYGGDTTAAASLVGRMAAAEAEIQAALTRGDLAGATALRGEAAVLLSRSIDRAPNRELLREAVDAIELWSARVREHERLEDAPALAAAMGSISRARGDAVRALAEGDSIRAARLLIGAGEGIRGWSPTVVAVRVLDRAAARVSGLEGTGGDAARAEHLIRTAREALRTGDPVRALQRAVYALQIADGQQIPVPPREPR